MKRNEREIPEFGLVGIESDVFTGVDVAAVVAQPDVVAAVGQHEGQRAGRRIDDPQRAALDDAVLQQNRSPFGVRDPVQFQDVAVARRHQVRLGAVAPVLDQLHLPFRADRLSDLRWKPNAIHLIGKTDMILALSLSLFNLFQYLWAE